MPGWFSAASDFASRSNRTTRSLSSKNASGRILRATSRASFVSVARYTSPIPPAPRGERISYGPTREPGCSISCAESKRFALFGQDLARDAGAGEGGVQGGQRSVEGRGVGGGDLGAEG